MDIIKIAIENGYTLHQRTDELGVMKPYTDMVHDHNFWVAICNFRNAQSIATTPQKLFNSYADLVIFNGMHPDEYWNAFLLGTGKIEENELTPTYILTDACMWERNKLEGTRAPHCIEVVNEATGQTHYMKTGTRIKFVSGEMTEALSQDQYNGQPI